MLAYQTTGRYNNSQFESVFNYRTSIKEHNIQAVAGYSYQEFEQNSSYVGNSDFDTDIFLYNNIAAGAYFAEGKGEAGSYKQSSTLIALFGRVMYNFNEKYLASASLRREGSSKFGDNNKWGLFPALSLGWRIHEEAFMQDVSWIDDLKFRVGYGVTGNQDFSPYRSLILLEQVGSLYYIRKSEDLLWEFQVSVPPYLYPYLFTNVGTISNRGVELTLNWQLMKRSNFQWNTTFTASHNKNVLDKITNDEFTQSSYETAFIGGAIGVWTQRIQEGEEVGTFYGPVWLGVSDEGYDEFKNQNPIGEVDKSDWEKIGTASPIAMLGWSNTLTFKNFDFSFNFRAGIGGNVLNTYRLYYESWKSIGLRNIVHTQYENPEFIGDITYSSKYVEDATFLKLDNLTLNYNFNIKSGYISKLSASVSAQNVWWIAGYQGIDPEVNLSGLEPGIDNLSYYPRTTSITLGVNASF